MQRYTETRDASSQLLRQVIPLISKQNAGFHPISYAVWYEYAAGSNPPLIRDIDVRLASGASLCDDEVYTLYEKFVAGPETSTAEKASARVEGMLSALSRQAASANQEVNAYDLSLNRFGESLQPSTDPQMMHLAVDAMLSDTRSMREKTSEFQQQLHGGAREVEALRAELKRLKGEALTDALSGIANRRGFDQAIADARSANNGALTGCSLIMLDIDHFKRCNDTYGHPFGDKVIRSIAQIVDKNVKGQDTAARIGGEEFAVLLPDTPLDGAGVLAERIRTMVAAGRIKGAKDGEPIGQITISLGVAQFTDGESVEALMARADKALYASKNGGRNRVTVVGAPSGRRRSDGEVAADGRR